MKLPINSLLLVLPLLLSLLASSATATSQKVDSGKVGIDSLQAGIYVVIGSYRQSANAIAFKKSVNLQHHNARIVFHPTRQLFYVYLNHGSDVLTAKEMVVEIRRTTQFSQAWLMVIQLGDDGTKQRTLPPENLVASRAPAVGIITEQLDTIDAHAETSGTIDQYATMGTEAPETLVPSKEPKKISLSWALHIMPFYRHNDVVTEMGSINPENRIARLSPNEVGLYVRPEFQLSSKVANLYVKPRLNFDLPISTIDNIDWESGESKLYFQQLKGKIQLSKSISLLGGRYVKLLGPSIFLTPSNPFFLNPGRLNPKIEIDPMDFVELNFSRGKRFSYSLISNISKGESEQYKYPFFQFSRTYAALVEYYANASNVGLIISADEKEKVHAGLFGQKNLNDAVVIWWDGALDYRVNRFYPVSGHSTSLLNYEMINGPDNDDMFFSGLVGASYTFSFGPTLQLEYYYNGKGYDRDHAYHYYQMIESSRKYTFDVTRELSNLNLGRSINSGLPFIRNNYIFTQIRESDAWNFLSYNLRYLYCLDDNSSQFSSLIELSVTDTIELFGVGLINFGSRRSDLNKLLDGQVMGGLLLKF